MQDRTGGERWIRWAAALCAVHCAVSPVLVLVVPLAAFGERLERWVLFGLVLVAAWLLVRGVRRHGRWLPALPVAGALLLWGSALGGLAEGGVQAVVIGTGGLLSAWGLRWSASLAHSCEGAVEE